MKLEFRKPSLLPIYAKTIDIFLSRWLHLPNLRIISFKCGRKAKMHWNWRGINRELKQQRGRQLRKRTIKNEFALFQTYRELKQLRRRRRLQKTIGLMIKTTALRVHHDFLVHFFDVHCTTTTWNLLIWRFMEDVDIRQRIFLPLFELE